MPTTRPVTKRALLARVNRVLAKSDEILKKAPERSRMAQYGPYYQVNVSANTLTFTQVNLEALARDLRCLAKWEHIEE